MRSANIYKVLLGVCANNLYAEPSGRHRLHIDYQCAFCGRERSANAEERPEAFPGDAFGNPRFWPSILPLLTTREKAPLEILDHGNAFVGSPSK